MGFFKKKQREEDACDAFIRHIIDSDFENYGKLLDAIQFCKYLDKCFFELLQQVEKLGTSEAEEIVRSAKRDRIFLQQLKISEKEREEFTKGLYKYSDMSCKEFRKYIQSFPPTFYDK